MSNEPEQGSYQKFIALCDDFQPLANGAGQKFAEIARGALDELGLLESEFGGMFNMSLDFITSLIGQSVNLPQDEMVKVALKLKQRAVSLLAQQEARKRGPGKSAK